MWRQYVAFLLFLPNSAAPAVPVRWTFSGVTFSPWLGVGAGGTATGSFVYDAGTNTYSEVDITTTSTGSHYTSAAPTSTSMRLISTTPDPRPAYGQFADVLVLSFNEPLTGAGAPVGIATDGATGGVESYEEQPFCIKLSLCLATGGMQTIRRSVLQGAVVGAPVTIPAVSQTALLASALLLCGCGVMLLRRGVA